MDHIKYYLTDKSRRAVFSFPFGHRRVIADSHTSIREKLVGSFSDRIDVPNGPFFINERMNRRCRAGRKFRICMAMQFARSLGTQKLGRAKSGGKTRRKRTRTSAVAVGKGGEKKRTSRRTKRRTARPSIFIRSERCPETFKAAAKAIRNPAPVTRDSANFTSHYFDRG